MWENPIFAFAFDHLEFYETFSDFFSDAGVINQLGLILCVFFKKNCPCMLLPIIINRRLWGFIPLDLEGRFKANYSEQADFLEEFPVGFE